MLDSEYNNKSFDGLFGVIRMNLLGRCGGVLVALLLVTAQPAWASENGDYDKDNRMGGHSFTSDSTTADRWFTTGKETRAMTSETPKAQKQRKNKEATRYVYLLNDNGYNYYMDSKNARWMLMPYTAEERIADVWVRLEPDGSQPENSTAKDAKGNYQYKADKSYYLEHYYLRPETQQIQFLCELEVTGRPDNAIKERAYSVQNWESLVPGSIEDDIYHAVLKNMQKNKFFGKHSAGKSVRDIIEDKLNIAL